MINLCCGGRSVRRLLIRSLYRHSRHSVSCPQSTEEEETLVAPSQSQSAGTQYFSHCTIESSSSSSSLKVEEGVGSCVTWPAWAATSPGAWLCR